MTGFTKNEINLESEEAGQELKKTRETRKLSLQDVSEKISISVKYLEALETGRTEIIPSGLYGEKFLCEYARFLGLDGGYLSEKFGFKQKKSNLPAGDPFVQRVPGFRYFISMPRIIRTLIIVSLVMVCVLYIGYLMKNILSSPELKILSPLDDLATTEQSITIRGKTDSDATVTINEVDILLAPDGTFSFEVYLKSGINTIAISSQKKYSKPIIIEKKVILSEK